MTNKTQPVNILLENYVFMVANCCIEQVDTELQARLINLLLEVGQEPRQDDLVTPEAIPDYKRKLECSVFTGKTSLS